MRRTYYDIQTGDVHIEATLTFKGKINANLQYELTIGEWVSEILDSGDYEYEVVQGSIDIDNIENDYEEME